MRSYGQYCGLAKGLDLIGERWTLLIVRELLIRERCRYSDLQAGLPGIATNMLADRLKSMEEAEIVRRVPPTPPVATPLFELTQRGKELESVLVAIGRWAYPLLGKCTRGDVLCGHWLVLPLRHLLADHSPRQKPVTIQVHTGEEPFFVRAGEGKVEVTLGVDGSPDAIVTGTPDQVFALLVGRTELAKARAEGLEFEGDVGVLRRVQPRQVGGRKLVGQGAE